MLFVPNLPRPWVPEGEGESANLVVRSEGEPRGSISPRCRIGNWGRNWESSTSSAG